MAMLNEKQQLMRKIQNESFALVEANLYLDSHPTCPMGLKYFAQHKKEYDELMEEYARKIRSDNRRAVVNREKMGLGNYPVPVGKR